jgi:large subunit ribosomal protein L21
MFAVIKTGGKQYRVAVEDVIRVDHLAATPGDIVEFGDVLMLGGDSVVVGAPTIAGATVAGELLQHTRGDKVIAFKKRRRKNSRRKRGYRHDFSVVRITEILTDGKKPTKVAKKAEPKPKAAAAPEEAAAAKKAEPKAAKKPAAKAKTGAAAKAPAKAKAETGKDKGKAKAPAKKK